jgi:hypothetical protein
VGRFRDWMLSLRAGADGLVRGREGFWRACGWRCRRLGGTGYLHRFCSRGGEARCPLPCRQVGDKLTYRAARRNDVNDPGRVKTLRGISAPRFLRLVATLRAKKTQEFVGRSALGPNQILFSHGQDPKRRYGQTTSCTVRGATRANSGHDTGGTPGPHPQAFPAC